MQDREFAANRARFPPRVSPQGHLLFMVRAWGYKSDLWVPRGSRSKAPVPPTTSAQQQLQQQALVPMAQAVPQTASQQLARRTDQRAVSTTDVFKSANNITTMVETVRGC